jgi:hypothetical protein
VRLPKPSDLHQSRLKAGARAARLQGVSRGARRRDAAVWGEGVAAREAAGRCGPRAWSVAALRGNREGRVAEGRMPCVAEGHMPCG